MTSGAPAEVRAIGEVRVRWIADPRPPRTLDQQARIDALWREAQAFRHGALFDGRILSLVESRVTGHGVVELVGAFVPYREFLAEQRMSSLGLGIAAVGVSGVAVGQQDGRLCALAAVRGAQVTQYPGGVELVPSGGISDVHATADGRVDYTEQLATELIEETGLQAAWPIRGFAWIYDPDTRTHDVVCEVPLGTISAAAFGRNGDAADEYAGGCRAIPLDDLRAFATRVPDLVPASRAAIDAYLRWRPDAARGGESR